jgi:hypothetical protein
LQPRLPFPATQPPSVAQLPQAARQRFAGGTAPLSPRQLVLVLLVLVLLVLALVLALLLRARGAPACVPACRCTARRRGARHLAAG